MSKNKLIEDIEAIRDEIFEIVMGFHNEKKDLWKAIAELKKQASSDSKADSSDDVNGNKGGTQKQNRKPENEIEDFFDSIDDDDDQDNDQGKDKRNKETKGPSR